MADADDADVPAASAKAQQPRRQWPPQMLRALRGPNYRLFFFGQAVSVIGTFMQVGAMGWLIYKLQGSVLLLGLVPFLTQLPTFLMTPLAGVLADRWDRRRMLVLTQSVAMLNALCLAALTLTGVIQVWHIIAVGIVGGINQAFDVPIRQSFVIQMVDRKEDLSNAIALNSSLINGGKLIGPSLAGVLIYAVNSSLQNGTRETIITGEGLCFLANGLSFIAVIGGILRMKIARPAPPRVERRLLASMHDGLRYVLGFPPILAALMVLACVSLVGIPYNTLLPVFARDVLGGDSRLNGLLLAAGGVGALAGALYMASRPSVIGLGRLIALGPAVLGVALVAFAFTPWWQVAVLLLAPAGLGQMILIASTNTLLQTVVDDDKRGRVLSFYTMCFMGMAPFGALLVGSVASVIGPRWTVAIGGGLCLVAGAAFRLWLPTHRRMLRPLYQRMGILPAAAPPVPAADGK